MRMVYQGTAMDGELSKTLVAGQTELRQWQSVHAANREMLRLLQATQKDPQHLVVAPASLLESQPTLRQLKQGLVEAQLRASVLAGTVTEVIPIGCRPPGGAGYQACDLPGSGRRHSWGRGRDSLDRRSHSRGPELDCHPAIPQGTSGRHVRRIL